MVYERTLGIFYAEFAERVSWTFSNSCVEYDFGFIRSSSQVCQENIPNALKANTMVLHDMMRKKVKQLHEAANGNWVSTLRIEHILHSEPCLQARKMHFSEGIYNFYEINFLSHEATFYRVEDPYWGWW